MIDAFIEPHLLTTRDNYDQLAEQYADFVHGILDTEPFDRAMIGVFAELVRGSSNRQVADIGCGPGHITDHLDRLGLMVRGVDLSPMMIELARRARPDLPFEVGSLFALDIEDGALGGLLAHYSIIHAPPDHVPAAFAEFARVLAPGGYLLVSFPTGDDALAGWEAFDHKVAPAYRWSVGALARLLTAAGLVEVARLRAEPGPRSRFPEGHLLARKPG